MSDFKNLLKGLEELNTKKMFGNDFFLTWDKTQDEINAVFAVQMHLEI